MIFSNFMHDVGFGRTDRIFKFVKQELRTNSMSRKLVGISSSERSDTKAAEHGTLNQIQRREKLERF